MTLTEIGQLRGLIYISAAEVPFTSNTLEALAHQATVSNTNRELTGVLVYRDRQFLQYLEGPGAALEIIYERIANDDRHYIQHRLDIPVSRRRFTDWGMRLLDPAWMPTVGGFDALHDLLRIQAHTDPASAGLVAASILDQMAVDAR